MFAKTSLKTKLVSLCVLLAAMTAIVGATSIFMTGKVVSSYEDIVDARNPNALLLARMRSESRKMRIHLTLMGLEGQTAADLEANTKEAESARQKFEEFNKKYLDIPFIPGEDALYQPAYNEWKNVTKLSEEIRRLAISDSKQDQATLMSLLTKDYSNSADKFNAAITKLLEFQDKAAHEAQVEAKSLTTKSTLISSVFSIAALALALILGLIFSSRLSKTLQRLADNLSTGATEVASASGQISEAGAELSASATEQAAALQQTVSSIDQVSAMVSKNADNAKRSQAVAETSKQAASRGKQAVEQMLTSIDDISRSNSDIMSQTEASNQEISNIVKVIAEIGNKTKVINDIVFQTKLLSFNASVEAARAGEHGKGFAVVAEEVGNLAQMSGNAAKEISQMLEESIHKVEKTVTDTKAKVERLIVTGKEKIETGVVTARRCGDALEEIVKNVSELNQMVGEISTASQEQAQGVQEITKAMGQLDQVTQQNASASQQAASASAQLNVQAASLHEMVSSLVQTVQGGSESAHHDAIPAQATKAASPAAKGTVVQFKRKGQGQTAKMATLTMKNQKVAVGSDVVPSEDDPRFQDV